MGRRYGLLPSEVLARATTFDLEMLDIAISYEAYQTRKAKGETPEVSIETMKAALEHVRNDSKL
jgi:hypothetical protein